MTDVDEFDLRTDTLALLERVKAGESFTVTVAGRPVATLGPISGRPRSMSRDRFIREVLSRQADPDLLADIRSLVPDSTDDLG